MQECIALSIRLNAFRQVMLAAVDLDNDSITERSEIHDVSTDGRLPSEMKAERLQLAQLYPHFHFLRRQALAKRASIGVCHDDPHPAGLRPATLPTLRGGGIKRRLPLDQLQQ